MSPRLPIRRRLSLATCIVIPVIAGACAPLLDVDLSNLCEGVGPLAKLEVSPSATTLRAGDSTFVGVSQRDAKGNDRFLCGADSVAWSTQAPAVATVSEVALGAWIKGVSPGQAIVRATAATKHADHSVTVIAR